MPEPVAAFVPHASILDIDPDEYDPELEYELSAVVDDQQRDVRLRHELIYVSPNTARSIDISEEHEIWDSGPSGQRARSNAGSRRPRRMV